MSSPKLSDVTPAIGIDLGTTYSRAAVYLKGKVTVIADDEGNRTTASCVAFTKTERLIGNAAKSQVLLNLQNTIFDSKRMIGRKYSEIQEDLENWQFKVVNEDGRPMIQAEDPPRIRFPFLAGEKKTFAPEEISAMVLMKLKQIAESYLDDNKVIDVVISVPASFNDCQRQATKDAGAIAGLKVIKIINEPTAAALAYAMETNLKEDKNVLVFDLGGGTLDVSVISIEEGCRFEVMSTAGNTHLGGEDFDNVLVAHFVEEFETKHQRDLRTCPKALLRLRIECELVKRELSSNVEANVDINCLFEGIRFRSKLTRAQFEDMCMDLFLSALTPVERALSDAKMDKGSIDEVVLVGGSTRIPKIQELLKDYFDGKELYMSPNEAVAYGAAVQAAMLTGLGDEKINSISMVDIAPFSIGIGTKEGEVIPIIKHHSQIPCVRSKTFLLNKSSIDIDVYEGEQAMTEDNHMLGRIRIDYDSLGPEGVSQINVMFELDSNGILDFTAESRHTKSIRVIAVKGGLSTDEIYHMTEEARDWEFVDKDQQDRNKVKHELITYVYSIKQIIEYASDDALLVFDRENVIGMCDYYLDWVEDNPTAACYAIHLTLLDAMSELPRFIDIINEARNRSDSD